MKNVILRNLERLIYSDYQGDKEPIEPMSRWKWNRLYQLTCEYQVGAWVADGIRCYQDDFFLNIPTDLLQKFLSLPPDKDPERIDKIQLYIDRSTSTLRRFSSRSVRAYLTDVITTVKNIEE